jgi:hypothetical protein
MDGPQDELLLLLLLGLAAGRWQLRSAEATGGLRRVHPSHTQGLPPTAPVHPARQACAATAYTCIHTLHNAGRIMWRQLSIALATLCALNVVHAQTELKFWDPTGITATNQLPAFGTPLDIPDNLGNNGKVTVSKWLEGGARAGDDGTDMYAYICTSSLLRV